MLRSLRTRLAVLFAGTLVLATVIAGAASIRLYQSYNRDQVKMELRSQVGSIAEYYGQALEKSNGGDGPATGPDEGGNPTPAPPRATAQQIARIAGSRLYAVTDKGGALFPQRRRRTSATPASSRRSTATR